MQRTVSRRKEQDKGLSYTLSVEYKHAESDTTCITGNLNTYLQFRKYCQEHAKICLEPMNPLHSCRPKETDTFWGQIKEKQEEIQDSFLYGHLPKWCQSETLAVKLASSLSTDTSIYSLFLLHQKVILGNKAWSVICWQAVHSKYEIFKR